ncbi:MAG: hypothetical protein V9E94_01165 [Microthrixaceae bacterium]
MSGTPFRSDTSAIPFVDYHLDEARADYEYGYGEALADSGVVRPVYFPRINGFMEWVAPDGETVAATFEDELPRELANQRLRTALSLEGEWLPTVLDQAHERLGELRRAHPEAGGLIIAMDQAHAQEHRRAAGPPTPCPCSGRGVGRPGRIRARSPRSRVRIEPWIVAVRMVSEGVDIPRLRMAVLRHDHHHRAVLPPGRRPSRALDPWCAAPEGVLLPARRPAPASLRRDSHRAAPPQPPQTSRRGTLGRARRTRTGRDRRR